MDDSLSKALAGEDCCPRCLGELDTGWECNDCDYDARPLIIPSPPVKENENA
jgi:hypothetical protein